MAKRRKTSSSAPKMEEVMDLDGSEPEEGPSGLTLEAGLIFTTFLALLVGAILAQLALKEYFGLGLLS